MQAHTDTDTQTHAQKHRQTRKQTLGGHVHAKPKLFMHACVHTCRLARKQRHSARTKKHVYTTQYTTGDCEYIHKTTYDGHQMYNRIK